MFGIINSNLKLKNKKEESPFLLSTADRGRGSGACWLIQQQIYH